MSLLYSWTQDRNVRIRDQADQVRSAAAKALAKLERWKELSVSLCASADPDFVKTTGMLFKGNEGNSAALDLYRDSLMSAHTAIAEQIRQEQQEVAYIDLDAYQPDIYQELAAAVQDLKNAEAATFEDVRQAPEAVILSFSRQQGTDLLAFENQLRDACADRYDHAFRKTIDDRLAPILKALTDLISQSDRDVLQHQKIAAPSAPAAKPGQ